MSGFEGADDDQLLTQAAATKTSGERLGEMAEALVASAASLTWLGADADALHEQLESSVVSMLREADGQLDAGSRALAQHAAEQDLASDPDGRIDTARYAELTLAVSLLVNRSPTGGFPMGAVSIDPRKLDADAKREHVLNYVSQPHGMKTKYLRKHGLSMDQMIRWRHALADGDLDRALYPRHTGAMTREDAAEIRRLQSKVADLEMQLESSRDDTDRMRSAADALGKAISAMQKYGAPSSADESASTSGSRNNTETGSTSRTP